MKSKMTFSDPLADGENYPPPEFSMLPLAPSSNSLRPRHLPNNVETTLLTTRARYGLALIAKALLGEGDAVLLPAYHCPALVEPFIWAGCHIKFYTMNADLSPNLDDFEKNLEATRAVLLVRYFGFDLDTARLAKLAREKGCLVIEDLAHAPYIKELYGDYGVTSLAKFFPVISGTEIWIANGEYGKAPSQLLEQYRRSPLYWHLDSALRSIRRKLFSKQREHAEETDMFRCFREEELQAPLSVTVMRDIAKYDEDKAVMARRENYTLLNALFVNSSIGTPLYQGLEQGTVPYVYPFILEDAGSFDQFRQAGVPLFRWEELASSSCDISNTYRSRLIQIACHQDLSMKDLGLIEATIKTIDRRLLKTSI